MNGQDQLLKSAEKDEVEQEVIRANFVRRVLGRPPASGTQVALEEEAYQQSSKGTSSISSAML